MHSSSYIPHYDGGNQKSDEPLCDWLAQNISTACDNSAENIIKRSSDLVFALNSARDLNLVSKSASGLREQHFIRRGCFRVSDTVLLDLKQRSQAA